MKRVALVGISGYGRWHLLMLLEQAALGHGRLTAATIINQTQEAGLCARLARHGVEIFSDYEAMLSAHAGRLDLVMLPTGIHHHAPMTLAALRAGAHVLVEKPLAPTLQEIDAIIAAEHACGRRVFVGFQDLNTPCVQEVQRRVIDGQIGRLERIVITGQWPREAAYFMRNDWAGRLRIGDAWVLDSPLNNAFAHFLMLGLFWASPVEGQAANILAINAELYRVRAIESFDTVCLRTETSGGARLEFYGSHSGHANLPPEVRLIGENGEIRWRYEQEIMISGPGRADEFLAVPDQLCTRLQVLDDALAVLRGEPRFTVSPHLARTHTHLVNAVHEHFPIHLAPSTVAGRLPGIDDAIAEGARSGRLFSEQGLPWAIPAGQVTIKNYERFKRSA
jgi:predicted dehydrogenase